MSGADRQQILQEQEAHETRSQERSTANQLVSQAAMEQGAAAPGYWDVIGNPDIKRKKTDENLDDFVATEMSDKFALSNITRSDWDSLTWQIENEFWTMQNEFKDQDCKLDPIDEATMYGHTRPELTNERARRLRSAMQVKKIFSSLGINARGLRSGTEIHAVAKTETPTEETESGGYLDRAANWLSG